MDSKKKVTRPRTNPKLLLLTYGGNKESLASMLGNPAEGEKLIVDFEDSYPALQQFIKGQFGSKEKE